MPSIGQVTDMLAYSDSDTVNYSRCWQVLEGGPFRQPGSDHWPGHDGLLCWAGKAGSNRILQPNDSSGSRDLWSVPASQTRLLCRSHLPFQCNGCFKTQLGAGQIHGLVSSAAIQKIFTDWNFQCLSKFCSPPLTVFNKNMFNVRFVSFVCNSGFWG